MKIFAIIFVGAGGRVLYNTERTETNKNKSKKQTEKINRT